LYFIIIDVEESNNRLSNLKNNLRERERKRERERERERENKRKKKRKFTEIRIFTENICIIFIDYYIVLYIS